MPERQYTHRHYLPKLLGEILAAVPALAPVAGPDGRPVAVLTLSGSADNTTLRASWPDAVALDAATLAALDATVAAHDPTPVPAQSDLDAADFAANLDSALAGLDSVVANAATLTAAQVRDAAVLEARILRRVLRVLRYVVEA